MTPNARSKNTAGRESYRVILLGIGKNTGEEKEAFCDQLSDKYSLHRPLLTRIVDQCPIVIKKNLTYGRADSLAKILRGCGARVAVEVKREGPPVFLEFQGGEPHLLAFESSSLAGNPGGTLRVVGRTRNISTGTLNDVWVVVQLFGNRDDFLFFEEVPLALNPLLPGEASPFKVLFEGDFPIQKILITFKNASGMPLATLDKRSKPEWSRVESDEEDQAVLSISLTKPLRPILQEAPEREPRREATPIPPGPRGEAPASEAAPLPEVSLERPEEALEEHPLELVSSEEEETQPETVEGLEEPARGKGEGFAETQEEKQSDPGEGVRSGDEGSGDERTSESPADRKEALGDLEVPSLDASAFEEASRLIQEISGRGEESGKGPVSVPWMEAFRRTVEVHSQERIDAFVSWFRSRHEDREFADDSHRLLVILAHARFDQTDDPVKALENTRRVFGVIRQEDLRRDGLPVLEATGFCSGEQWRDLFYRAIPKLRQVSQGILERKRWKASEVQRLIQVIPHMSDRSSRKGVRWVQELMRTAVEIDLSDLPISIDSNLYRVACRLGIVDPRFDAYRGKSSIGDLKIQAFGRSAFPEAPSRIEDPMAWVGSEGNGGHCHPSDPRCEGCLFESFCEKRCLHFDPSEKGMSHG